MAFMAKGAFNWKGRPPGKPLPILRPRRCKYCRGTFVPERAQDKDQRFCCGNHRKAYWRFGGLPFDKMKTQIFKEVKKLVRDLVRAELKVIAEETRALLLSATRSAPEPPQSNGRESRTSDRDGV